MSRTPVTPRERSTDRRSNQTETWTSRRLLEWMTGHFRTKNIDSPRVVAEMLLAHIIGCERMRLYMEIDRPASAGELATLRDLIARAARHEPVQYLVGHAWLFSRRFEVDRSTLIPRPSTEALVEHVLQWHRATPGVKDPLLADIGTGTGCIAISLAAQLRSAHIIATDIRAEALALAKRNAEQHKVADRIEFVQGDGLAPLHRPIHGLPGVARFDIICSNPPYISDAEWHSLPPNVKGYEPASALRGGADGLDIIRPLIAESPPLLKPAGQLVLEIADSQRDTAIKIVRQTGAYDNSLVLKDHEGLWRVLVAERRSPG